MFSIKIRIDMSEYVTTKGSCIICTKTTDNRSLKPEESKFPVPLPGIKASASEEDVMLLECHANQVPE